MATFKVFVSSTAYDLGVLRSSLREFIGGLGFEAVLSEYSDVLYDPREHTHASCIAEVRNCDAVVLIIGSRFGGEAIPGLINEISRKRIDEILSDNKDRKFSITQAEALAACDEGVPVFAFVDSGVLHDYRVYSLNPDTDITYPSISQANTAKYIFEFINFLQSRSYGNAVIPFARLEEVTGHLRKQWAALFQRLLHDSRATNEEARRIDRLSEQFDDLKAALLATVGDGDARRVARGVVRYRRLLDFVRSIPGGSNLKKLVTESKEALFHALKECFGIEEVITTEPTKREAGPYYSLLVTANGDGYLTRLSALGISRMSSDWDDFKEETTKFRTIIYDTLSEEDPRPMTFVRPISKQEVETHVAERAVARKPEQLVEPQPTGSSREAVED